MAAHGVDGVVQLLAEDLAIEEEQRAEGLVLRGGGDVALDGQVGEERLDLRAAHIFGVALAVEQDEAPDPIDVGLLGADGVVLDANRVAHLIEQLLFRRFFRGFGHDSPLDSAADCDLQFNRCQTRLHKDRRSTLGGLGGNPDG